MRAILAVLLENEAGALSRVVGLFAQRNYNIETLTVAPTEDLTLSRLTLTTTGDQDRITQIIKQLDKLIEVIVLQICVQQTMLSENFCWSKYALLTRPAKRLSAPLMCFAGKS